MLTLLARLADREQRGDAARGIARHLGADELVFFTVDPQSDALLPALGFPQTMPDGIGWRAFLGVCRDRGEATAELPSPFAPGRHRVHGISAGSNGAIVLIGGKGALPDPGPELQALLPLLAAVFHADRLVHSAQGETRSALDAATRAAALAEALDGARRSLAAVNLALQGEVTERRRAEAALADADRRKDEFLATLAHELRNPLAPIRNCVHLLRREGPGRPGTPGIVDMMERQVEHLVRLVDDLMDVARITRGKLELRCEHVDLHAVIERAVESSRPVIDAQGHTLDVSIPGHPLMLDADPVRLAQALANLLNNAAKYTAPGGRIELLVTPVAPDVEIRIRDSGIGIPADMLSRVFDMFTQVESSLDRSSGGLGIGLMLVRRLIELHHGRVTAESDGESRGSTFIVHLPMLADVAVPRLEATGPGNR